MMWKKLTENNCHEWKLSTAVDPMKGNTGVRFVKHEASQPPGGCPTYVGDAPAHTVKPVLSSHS